MLATDVMHCRNVPHNSITAIEGNEKSVVNKARFKAVVLNLLVLMVVLSSFPANAAEDKFSFDTPAQRESFLTLTAELRCPMCQNQNIVDDVVSKRLDVPRRRSARYHQEIHHRAKRPDVNDNRVERLHVIEGVEYQISEGTAFSRQCVSHIDSLLTRVWVLRTV